MAAVIGAAQTEAASSAQTAASESEVKLDWMAQIEDQARIRKRENDLKKCEDKINTLEERQAAIEEEMARPEVATNVAKLQELSKEQDAITAQLEELYELWETLA